MAHTATAGKKPSYYTVWLWLLILTVGEVLVAFTASMPKTYLVIALLFLALWKAALVAMYYMHLKFEPPRLVLMVMAPLPLAILLVLTVLMEGF